MNSFAVIPAQSLPPRKRGAGTQGSGPGLERLGPRFRGGDKGIGGAPRDEGA